MTKKAFLIPLLLIVTLLCYADDVVLPQLEIRFDAKIKKNMPYANGSMKLTDTDGSVVELNAKFKTRGATAQQYLKKPSLNMKLSSADYELELDSTLLGLRSCSSWILDAMAIDRICMRNRVAFDIWNEFSRLPYETQFDGRNGTIGRFVELYINDTYYGIYCLTDRINRKLLDLKKPKDTGDGNFQIRGVLYKSGTNLISDQNSFGYNDDYTACTVSWHNAWELSYPEDYLTQDVWHPLVDAILNGKNMEYVNNYFYLENLADYQILVTALSIGDNMGNKNHYLSVRNISKDIDSYGPDQDNPRRFVLTPWDLDTSLGGNYNGSYYGGNYSNWKVQDVNKNPFYPISVVQGDPEYKAILKRRWEEGREGAFSVESVKQKLETYCNLFVKSGAWQRMWERFSNVSSGSQLVQDLETEIQLIEQWYEDRFKEMDTYFGIASAVESVYQDHDVNAPIYNINGQYTGPTPTIRVVIQGNKKYYYPER